MKILSKLWNMLLDITKLIMGGWNKIGGLGTLKTIIWGKQLFGTQESVKTTPTKEFSMQFWWGGGGGGPGEGSTLSPGVGIK